MLHPPESTPTTIAKRTTNTPALRFLNALRMFISVRRPRSPDLHRRPDPEANRRRPKRMTSHFDTLACAAFTTASVARLGRRAPTSSLEHEGRGGRIATLPATIGNDQNVEERKPARVALGAEHVDGSLSVARA